MNRKVVLEQGSQLNNSLSGSPTIGRGGGGLTVPVAFSWSREDDMMMYWKVWIVFCLELKGISGMELLCRKVAEGESFYVWFEVAATCSSLGSLHNQLAGHAALPLQNEEVHGSGN